MEARATGFLCPPQPPYSTLLPPPAPFRPVGFDLKNRVSPGMLLLIIILAVIIFISGVLHLVVRFLLRPPLRDPDQEDDVSALQGQLQQLFHLHDAGVDQSFIDALPVFDYKSIIGVKDPFDCAVCLCEFEPEDKLRLLPKCSHAFHVDCIATWLLSHSTCPLCRASLLLADFPPLAGCSPVVLVLESGESSREIISDYNNITGNNSLERVSSHSSDDFRAGKSSDISKPGEKILSVKLGKFRNINGGGSNNYNGGDGDYNASTRRCFSMGSFAYVLDEGSSLRVPIRIPVTKQPGGKKTPMALTPGHRPTMSECGSAREHVGFEAISFLEARESKGKCSFDSVIKKESFSMSKIWTRGGKRDEPEESRRAFSFRLSTNHGSTSGECGKGKGGERRVASDIEMGRWGRGGVVGSDSEGNVGSVGRRTVLWIMGRPSKVVHSSGSSDV